MKLKMYFLMLALGVCGAAMQSCDDDDDNLKVPEKLQSAFSQKYPEASPKWKTRGNYYIADFKDHNYKSEALFCPKPSKTPSRTANIDRGGRMMWI